METWQIVLLVVVVAAAVAGVAGFWLWRHASRRTREIASRVQRLPWQGKLELAARLARDERIPTTVRLVLPLVALYLALPVDFIPDFLPVVGHLDDVLVVLVGAGILMKFAPVKVLEDHIATMEMRWAARTTSSLNLPSPPSYQ